MSLPETLEIPAVLELQTEDQMEILDIVDALRVKGLGEITSLPQLIVCGDQSSGKSSVLEAISGIPFPRQDDVCTRFATEVILRRATHESMNISIVPSVLRSAEDRVRLLNFQHKLSSRNDFPNLVKDAKTTMAGSGVENTFYRDILRVELCGPAQPQLTLVDLPGLIHAATDNQGVEDVKMVNVIVTNYLKNPRSIILAVVSAQNDIGIQAVLTKVRSADPDGKRTFGIITKPDTLRSNSPREESYLKLARNSPENNVNKFDLGWHVVKNLDLGAPEISESNRDNEERLFFEKSNFRTLPSHILGIASLRRRLSKVLFQQIQMELPGLIADITSRITMANRHKERLGPSRSTPNQQKTFMIELSESFQTICRDAIKGDYDHAFFKVDAKPERRLCSNIMNKHRRFGKILLTQGSEWNMEDDDSAKIRALPIIDWACKILRESRGRELPGLPNPSLVGELFRSFKSPWAEIAEKHIYGVYAAIKGFLELLLDYLTDTEVGDRIFRYYLTPILERQRGIAAEKLKELLEVYEDYPMTLSPSFQEKRASLKQFKDGGRIRQAFKERARQNHKFTEDDVDLIFDSRVTEPQKDDDLIAAKDAIDDMYAFYEVSRSTFMDNVPTLVIQGPMVRQLPKIFCPTAVNSMEATLVAKIAGESEEKIQERNEVHERLKLLETGASTFKQWTAQPRRAATKTDPETPSKPFASWAATSSPFTTLNTSHSNSVPPNSSIGQKDGGSSKLSHSSSVSNEEQVSNTFSGLSLGSGSTQAPAFGSKTDRSGTPAFTTTSSQNRSNTTAAAPTTAGIFGPRPANTATLNAFTSSTEEVSPIATKPGELKAVTPIAFGNNTPRPGNTAPSSFFGPITGGRSSGAFKPESSGSSGGSSRQSANTSSSSLFGFSLGEGPFGAPKPKAFEDFSNQSANTTTSNPFGSSPGKKLFGNASPWDTGAAAQPNLTPFGRASFGSSGTALEADVKQAPSTAGTRGLQFTPTIERDPDGAGANAYQSTSLKVLNAQGGKNASVSGQIGELGTSAGV